MNYVKRTGNSSSSRSSTANVVPAKSDRKWNTGCCDCGSHSHFAKACQVAKGWTCHKCYKVGHLAKVCRSTEFGATDAKSPKVRHGKFKVQYAQEDSDEDAYYVFNVSRRNGSNGSLKMDINGVPMDMLVDSGSNVNLISFSEWNNLKINEEHRPTQKSVSLW